MRPAPTLAVALLGLAGLAGCFAAGPPTASHAECSDAQVYVNGLVWTADPKHPQAEAFVVRNGSLSYVGNTSAARALCSRAPVTDLKGHRVVPGFIDSHSHFVRVASTWDCSEANDPFKPTFDNSQLAMIQAEESRARIGANHQQINQSGKTPVDDTMTITDKAAAAKGIECAMKEANAMGLTMTVEAGSPGWDYLDVLQSMEKVGKITERQSLYLVPPMLAEAKNRGIHTGWGTDYVRVAGIKFYSDGWLGPRSSALLAPYNDRPTSRGVLFLEQPEADQWVEAARSAGLKAATHTIGDQGVAVLLNSYTKAYEAAGPDSDLRPSFEHAQVLQPRFVEGMKKIHAIVSYQLSFATTDQRFAESALGKDRVAYSYIWKTLMDNNITLAGGSDFPIEVLPPLWGLQRTVTRQELDGTPNGGWYPAQRLSVEQALTTITRNAAYNVFMEDRLGSLEAGKLADFVVLDQDILHIDPHQIASTCVLATYVGGVQVYDGAGSSALCSRVKYAGVLPNRDPDTGGRIEAQLQADALRGLTGPGVPEAVLK